MLGTEFTPKLAARVFGKTLIRKKTVCNMENEADVKVRIVDVNMREYPSQEEGLQKRAATRPRISSKLRKK